MLIFKPFVSVSIGVSISESIILLLDSIVVLGITGYGFALYKALDNLLEAFRVLI